jgi:hypothetical protein
MPVKSGEDSDAQQHHERGENGYQFGATKQE